MLKDLKKKLYFSKAQLLFDVGIIQRKIVLFDDEFYNKMSNTFFNCIPISMHIKYLKPTTPPGKCYDRSLYMFLCFDDALLVRGDNKDLELKYGKESAGHGWIEIGDYVYDPSLLIRFDKDLYYKIFCPTNVSKCNKEEYRKLNGDFYDEVRNTKIEDFKIGGKRRADLCVSIPLVHGIAEYSNNEEFKRELDQFLTKIEYDEKQVHDELIEKCRECLILEKTKTKKQKNNKM